MYDGGDFLLLKQFCVKCTECFKDVAADMNEVVDSDSLEVIGACGGTCHDKLCAAVKIFEGCGSEFCIFVVA